MLRGGGVRLGEEADDFAVIVGQERFDVDAAEFVEAVDGLLEQIVRAGGAGRDADDDVALGQPVVA